MADKFGGQKDGRQTTGASFYDVPAVPVNANALYFPNFPASPFFGVAEYPVAAGDLGAFSTAGVFVFDKPVGWIDNAGRKVFYRPKTAATGEIVAQEIKGDVFVGYQIVDNINPQKLGVLLAPPEFCMNVLMVTSTADSGAGSLRQAIADANDGDVILFDSDVFPAGQTTSILLSLYITVNKSVSIYGGFNDGAGGYTSGATKRFYVYREIEGVKTKVYIDDDNPAQENETVLFENVCRVALDGQEAVRCVYTTDGVILWAGIGFINGHVNNSNGGGFYARDASRNTLNDCAINGCSVDNSGGGFFSSYTSQNTLNDCNINDCSGATGGGVYSTSTSANTLNGCTLTDCNATSYGGGVGAAVTSRNMLNGCTITNCSATSGGGGFYLYGTSINTLNNCIITSCNASSGGGVYSANTSTNTLNGCTITGCSATSGGGGFYLYGTSINTLNNCIITSCNASSGGGVYSANTSTNTLNGCTITGCSATSGGGLRTADTSQNTLTGCTFDGCSATNGGAVYSLSASQNTLTNCVFNDNAAESNGGALFSTNTSAYTLTDCVFSGNTATNYGAGLYATSTSQNTLNGCTFDASSIVYVLNASAIIISGGITTIAAATLNAATITINDGAALTITTSATIGAATFTSEGRGYLAVGAGIDISSATLTNVVACTYGAGLESFDISTDGASWTADDLTTPILIETRDAGGDWQTLTNNATGGEYATTFALESTARAFDGVAFFVATLPGYWQADADAVDANDWSVKGFAAANSNGGGDAQGDAAQGWTVTPSTVTPNADGV